MRNRGHACHRVAHVCLSSPQETPCHRWPNLSFVPYSTRRGRKGNSQQVQSTGYKQAPSNATLPQRGTSTTAFSLHEAPARCKESAVVEARLGRRAIATWPFPAIEGLMHWKRFDMQHFRAWREWGGVGCFVPPAQARSFFLFRAWRQARGLARAGAGEWDGVGCIVPFSLRIERWDGVGCIVPFSIQNSTAMRVSGVMVGRGRVLRPACARDADAFLYDLSC